MLSFGHDRKPRRSTVILVVALLAIAVITVLYKASSIPSPHSRLRAIELNVISQELDRLEKAEQVEKELPSVPFVFWYLHENYTMQFNNTCARFPNLFELNYKNNYWQTFENAGQRFELYGAYYDTRPVVPNGPILRILAMAKPPASGNFPQTYCQIWYSNKSQPLFAPLTEYNLIWYPEWSGNMMNSLLHPYLLGCSVPTDVAAVPRAVSLVTGSCEHATNSLKVIYDIPAHNETKREFVVCVKALHYPFEDRTGSLIEWLELMRLLGADKVMIHDMGIHPDTLRTLAYYQTQKYVELRSLTMASGDPFTLHYQHYNLQPFALKTRLQEPIPYNDCLYRHMYRYKYIVVIDTDEVPMPIGNLTTWHDLVRKIERSNDESCTEQIYSAICFRATYFPPAPPNVPNPTGTHHHYMMEHRQRYFEYLDIGYGTKCIHNTSHVLSVHNHFPREWMRSCHAITPNVSLAQLNHYRNASPGEPVSFLVRDDSIERFAPQLRARVDKVVAMLDATD